MPDRQIVVFDGVNQLRAAQAGDVYHFDLGTSKFDLDASFLGNIAVSGTVDGRNISVDGIKLDWLTVTQAVDLDTMEARINAMSAAVTLAGSWAPSGGVFPTSTVAGESYICSDAGTVNSIPFNINDRIVALVDGASTSVYANQWLKLDYTDNVLSVAGKTGTVVLVEADITDLQNYLADADIDTMAKLDVLVSETIIYASAPALLTADWDMGDNQIELGTVVFKNQASPPTHNPGEIFYQSAKGGGFQAYVEDVDVTLNIGEEEWITVRNDTGVTIPDGTAVCIVGHTNGVPQIDKILADGQRLLGITTHSIEDNTFGKVTRAGRLTGPDLTSFSVSDTLYVSAVTAGELVNVRPLHPLTVIEIGSVIDNSNPGIMIIDIEHHGTKDVINKSYNFSARTAASGVYYLAGFYNAPAADANLSNASPTQTLGTANSANAAHVFMVFGTGSTDGTNVTLTITGSSITDGGVRVGSDSEVLYTGTIAALTLNDYLESTKKWLGQVTYTLTSDGGTFTLDFNYGFVKYEDFSNIDVTIVSIEIVGLADATDNGFNIEFIHHKSTNWTYHASSFVPGPGALMSFAGDLAPDDEVKAGEFFAWKRTLIGEVIASSQLEGLMFKVTTTANNSIAYLNAHIAGVLS